MDWFLLRKDEGQAVIEFVLGLLIVISFFFFFIRMSAIFAIGNYIHYMTFMAARTYASSTGTADPVENARQVLHNKLNNSWRALIKPADGDGIYVGPGQSYGDTGAINYWNHGATYHFKAKLELYPFTQSGQAINLDLTSQSWMPIEETVDICNQKKTAAKDATGVSSLPLPEWENGC